MTAYETLAAHIAEYNDLLNILNTLKWDMRTKMPAGGSRTRGAQLETLTKLAKDMFVSETTARLLDAAEVESTALELDTYQARALQQTRQFLRDPKAHPCRTGRAHSRAQSRIGNGLGTGQRSKRLRYFQTLLKADAGLQHRAGGGHRLRRASLRRPGFSV